MGWRTFAPRAASVQCVECIACQTNLVTGRNCRSPWVWVLGNFFALQRIIKSIPTGRWRGEDRVRRRSRAADPRFRGGRRIAVGRAIDHIPAPPLPRKAFRVGDRQTLMDRVDGQTAEAAVVCVRLFLSKTQCEGRLWSEEQYPCRV